MGADLDENWGEKCTWGCYLVTRRVARQFARALAQNCQDFAKVWTGYVAFKEGQVLSLPRLIKAMERQFKVSQVKEKPNRD